MRLIFLALCFFGLVGFICPNSIARTGQVGLKPPHISIINGISAQTGDFPFMASLLFPLNATFARLCGGTLIASSYILTAAHCVDGLPTNTGNGYVFINTLNITGGIGSTNRRVSSYVAHQNFSMNTTHILNDVALLVLDQPVTAASNIPFVQLPIDAALAATTIMPTTGPVTTATTLFPTTKLIATTTPITTFKPPTTTTLKPTTKTTLKPTTKTTTTLKPTTTATLKPTTKTTTRLIPTTTKTLKPTTKTTTLKPTTTATLKPTTKTTTTLKPTTTATLKPTTKTTTTLKPTTTATLKSTTKTTTTLKPTTTTLKSTTKTTTTLKPTKTTTTTLKPSTTTTGKPTTTQRTVKPSITTTKPSTIKPIITTTKKLAARLRAFSTYSNQSAIITGWGVTATGSTSWTLQKANVTIYDNAICNQQWGTQFNGTTQVCAAQVDTATCFGDSGGPLLVNGSVQVGVVSFGSGNGCADPAHVPVFTRVSAYLDWIAKTMASNPPPAAGK